MATDDGRDALTFKQNEGIDPLPSQASLGSVPNNVRSKLHLALLLYIDSYEDDRHNKLPLTIYNPLLMFFIENFDVYVDEFPNDIVFIRDAVKKILSPETNYEDVLQFVEHLSRGDFNKPTIIAFARILEDGRLAYRLVDNSIIRFTTEEEHGALINALDGLGRQSHKGAAAHLIKASGELTKGNWAASVRESINSVESLVRELIGSNSFGAGIKELEKNIRLHQALRAAMGSLYGYTSDEQGIRHALIDNDQGLVDEATALYMHTSCASFISFVLRQTYTTKN